jgi:predicted RNase H-like HicB family nuclease
MEFEVDFDREEDGRWIAEIVGLPGLLAYGATREEAQQRVEGLAKAVLTEPKTKF